MYGRIIGTGSFVPAYVRDNEDIARTVDTNDQWIRERTGICRRHIVTEETTVSMAIEAAKRSIDSAGCNPEDIDVILVSTVSSNVLLPNVASQVQAAVGAVNAFVMDLNAACTGFMFAFHMVQNMMMAGTAKVALIIGSESLSQLVDWTDRGTCILFGDGAGATVIQACEGDDYVDVLHSDGSQGQALYCESRHQKDYEEAMQSGRTHVAMDGQAVFKFAIRKVPACVQEVLDKAGCCADDIDMFLMHQANYRILESIARKLKVPMDKMPSNILLDELVRDGRVKAGDRCVMAGFGAGLSWGAACFTF